MAYTVLEGSELMAIPGLYAYVGEATSSNDKNAGRGGSSSVFSTIPLSSLSEDTWKGISSRPDNAGVYLIAGGGGGGGSWGLEFAGTSDVTTDGGDGGKGGTAVARSSSPVTGHGSNGAEGSADSGGSGGNPTDSSFGGVGGRGGGTGWRTSGSMIPPSSWSPGSGESASEDRGQGGGGFGGGHRGGKSSGLNEGAGGGGGGGGSFAAGNSREDQFRYRCTRNECVDSLPSNPNGNNGVIGMRYRATSRRSILYRMNADQSSVAASDGGPKWVSVNNFLVKGGDAIAYNSSTIATDHHSLADVGAPAELFQFTLVDSSGGDEMEFEFPVQNGDEVEVRLLLVEGSTTVTAPAQHTFSVKVEGSIPTAFNTLDPYAIGGGRNKGTMVSAVHTMTDSTLNIEFVHIGLPDPEFAAIEIMRVGTKNVVGHGELSTTTHPDVTSCLTLADAGVILSNLNHELIWQSDGDLVLYDASRQAIWRSNTEGRGTELCFQSGGNLLITDSSSSTIFSTGTGNGGRQLILDNSCNLKILSSSASTLYQTNTNCSSQALPTFTPTHTPTFTPTHTRPPTATPTATDSWSAHLGSMRFLNDGKEQAVLRPRKDAASLYTPASERLQSYAYDAFGSRDESPRSYDLQQNPYQYTGEYRDPVWGGYYLRARWYHPDLPLFVSRDPLPFLNRYSYTDGNPVMRSDPSGMSYMSAFGRPFGKFLSKINKGVGGDFARLFLAPILGPLQILANPAGFWDQIKHDRNGIDVFLALGIASEIAGGVGDYLYAGYAVSIGKRFLARAAWDTLIGLGQTVTASASRGFNHFDWQSFRQGAELTAGSIFARSYTGANVRSGFRLDTGDVLETIKRLDREPGETALVFRMKTRIQSLGRASDYLPSAKPLQQAFKIGAYHETLIAVTKDDVFVTEAFGSGVHAYRIDNPGYAQLARSLRSGYGPDARYELAGTVYDFDTRHFLSNPRDRPVAQTAGLLNVRHSLAPKVDATEYGNLLNNCQHHAAGVLKNLGLR